MADAGGALAVADCRSEPDVIAALQAEQPHALLVQFAPIGAAAIGSAGDLRAIVRYGVGLDNVDTDAARAAGIQLGLVPDYCIDEVADHTFALLLAVARGVVDLATSTRAGAWDWRAAQPVRRLRGQTLGLLGYGRVGQAVAQRASGFGLQTLIFDPAAPEQSTTDLTTLLRQTNILSVHVPLTDETRGMIGTAELELLPAGAIVLNASRGGIIDEDALAAALDSGHLAGAGLDVLATEPPLAGHPLIGKPGLVLTPHTAWYSEESILELRRRATEQAITMARS